MMRIALNVVRSCLGDYVIILMKSSLPQDYADQIQAYLEAGKHPDCPFYDPTFPWDSADVGLLYFGLKEEADMWTTQLPDGRIVRAWNINPGCSSRMANAFDDYSRAMDAGRRVLLSGGTAEDAVKKLSEFCNGNQFLPNLESDLELRANILEEMEEYREILDLDAQSLGIKIETTTAESYASKNAE